MPQADLSRPAVQFSPEVAFSRNIGWITQAEQRRLLSARVAIGGLGGVGGVHLLTMARLGIGRFSIADFDEFGLHNFNRQAGAFMSTLGQSKADVMQRMALDINPMADLRVFREGVTPDNLERFLNGVDVYVDGIDFFAVEARRMIFAACSQRGIPAITAAPLGIGTALLWFDPKGMSFEDYFKLEGHPRQEQLVRFLAGLSPAMLQRHYLADPGAIRFSEQAGPSTTMACELCAGVTATTVMKLLLGRGPLRPAPWAMQFDAYQQQLKYTWRPWGNAHPLQWLLMRLIRSRLGVAPTAG